MKSECNSTTAYGMCMFNRDSKEQIIFRQKIVQYAQIHGNKPAARKYGCSKNTIKTWRRRFEAQGTTGLQNKSRAPLNSPLKTSIEVEEQIIEKRKEMPCYGPKRLKYFNPSLKASEGAIYRILKEKGLLRKHRKKYQKKNDLREVKAKYKSLTHHQEDVKHLYDISNYSPQMEEGSLPKYEYTIRDVKSGFTIVAFSNEYSEQYSEMLTEVYLGHLKAFGMNLQEVVIQTDNGSEFGARKRNLTVPGFVNTIVEMKEEMNNRLVTRNGYLPERDILTGIGPINVRQPRVRDKRDGEEFSSAVLPTSRKVQ
ncbi:MAG: helix-turn-helix domain containing protein [Simkaniaceae bacterium]|nr:helix-turn-helix domain containing protein [Simkaniaceae bacterium]